MSPVQRLFSEPAGPTVVSCDWCGKPAIVCTAAERYVGGQPARIGLCEEHHEQLVLATSAEAAAPERAAYERRRLQRDVELRTQRNAWRRRKAARHSGSGTRPADPVERVRAAPTLANAAPDRPGGAVASGRDASTCPQDSEELIASIMQGERAITPVQVVDPRLEDPARRIERLQEALWPLVRLAEESGIYIDCNPSQQHSVLVVGEVPVQALFRARDLLKRER